MSVILNFFFIIQAHDWVTGYGLYPLPTEQDNCHLVEVTENEVNNSVNSYPKLDTLILVKSMIKNHSFQVMGKQNCCLFDTSVRLFVCQSVCLFDMSVYLICLSVCLSVCLMCLSVYVSICLSVCLSVCLVANRSVCPYICSMCLSVRYVSLSVISPLCLSVYLICLSVNLSV